MKSIKWTVEKIALEAKKYNNRSDFFKKSGGAYNKARSLGLLDEICSHMKESKNFPWTKEELQEEALKYKTRGEFQKNSRNMYKTAFVKGILDEICGHMEWVVYPWSDKELTTEALKYKTRADFREKSPKAYAVCVNRDIMDRICSHMERLVREDWKLEELVQEAFKYNSRWEFQIKSKDAYKASYRRGILDQICGHMQTGTCSSMAEDSLMEIVQSYYPMARKLVDRKADIEDRPYIWGFDLDIFVSELGLAIEFDGKYYHSFKGLKRGRKHWPDEALRQYHEIKDSYFLSKGIKVLHIKETDWLKDKQACIQLCLDFLSNDTILKIA